MHIFINKKNSKGKNLYQKYYKLNQDLKIKKLLSKKHKKMIVKTHHKEIKDFLLFNLSFFILFFNLSRVKTKGCDNNKIFGIKTTLR